MSKGARKTGGGYKRAMKEKSGLRNPSPRAEKTTVLIVGAGRETEPNYFRALSREESVSRRFAVTIKKGPGQSPDLVVASAARIMQRERKYDEVWCILDVEAPDHRKTLEEALKTAEEHDIQVCLSNPSFEVWLLAHFEKTHKAFGDFKGVFPALNKHWREHFSKDYERNDEGIFRKLSQFTNAAISNAKWVREKHHGLSKKVQDCDSSTDVYRLVERLTSPQEVFD